MKRFMKRVTAIVMTILLALPTGFGFSEEQGMSLSDAIVTSSDAVYTSDDMITADAAINADVGSDSEEEEITSGAVDPVVGEADDVELGGEEDPALEETAVTTYWFLVNDELYDEQTVGDGEALIQPEDPTAPEGSAFIGWFLEDGTQLFIKDEEISHTDPECPFVNVVARFEDVAEPGDGEAVPGNTPVDTEAGGNTPVDEENNDTPTDVEEKDAPTDADATGETNPDTIEDDAENAADTTTTPEAEDEENATPGDNAASDEDETPAPDEDETPAPEEGATPAPDAEQSEDGAENTPKKGETDETDADSDNTDSDETSDGEQGKTGETSDEEKGEEADEQEDGEEIQPVRVTFSTEPEDAVVTVFAVQKKDEDVGEGAEEGEIEKDAEQGEPEAVEAEDDGSWLLMPGEYTYSASAEGYKPLESVPFIVTDGALEISITLEPVEEVAEETIPFDQSCTIGSVTITVRAAAGAFPAGAELLVNLVNVQARREADEAIDEVREESQNVAAAYTYDIKVVDEEGNELQPADGYEVEVSFAMVQAADGNLEANVYHVTEEDGELKAEKLETEAEGETVTAVSEGFSLYTVEFTYNKLEYVLQGDSEVPLSVILEALGLSGEVTAVEISDTSLFSASNETGEWIITAHQAFSTTEWMKVTINGVTYDITVTDDTNFVLATVLLGENQVMQVGGIKVESGVYSWENNSIWNWYIVSEDVTLDERVTVQGTVPVNLILCDGAKLIAKKGITISTEGTLNILAGSTSSTTFVEGSGALFAGTTDGTDNTCQENAAGIGGQIYQNGTRFTINIYGGTITSVGADNGPGIGGGLYDFTGATVNIYGGKVTATGGFNSAGIGGGFRGNMGNINISGGVVTATGGYNGAGIGCGIEGRSEINVVGYYSSEGRISISGGTVTATGGTNAAGIGGGFNSVCGRINITGGTITAKAGKDAAAIGNGASNVGGIIEINDGTVVAIRGEGTSSGIGNGAGSLHCTVFIYTLGTITTDSISTPYDDLILGDSHIHINVGRVLGDGRINWANVDRRYDCAMDGSCVRIEGFVGHVFDSTGFCPYCGASSDSVAYWDPTTGEQRGCEGYTVYTNQMKLSTGWYLLRDYPSIDQRIEVEGDVNFLICDGKATTAAYGFHVPSGSSITFWQQTENSDKAGLVKVLDPGANMAGIGGNDGQDGGIVTINGGIFQIVGGENGAGIGGGSGGSGGAITIRSGKVTVKGGKNGAGIGGGSGGACGNVTITGGTVSANGGENGAGIGGGIGGSGGAITITGGIVEATGANAFGPGKGAVGTTDMSFTDGVTSYADLRVSVGNSAPGSVQLCDPVKSRAENDAVRAAACMSKAYAKLETCDHRGDSHGYIAISREQHIEHCWMCDMVKEAEDHNYNIPVSEDMNQCICGALPLTEEYVNADGSKPDGSPAYCLNVNANTKVLDDSSFTGGWYAVTSDIEISSRITVSGNVNLILCDNHTLTAKAGINVTGNNSLTVWAQSTDESCMGRLRAGHWQTTPDHCAGIGGSRVNAGGTTRINGGIVEVTGGYYAAGIGGGNGGVGGTIEIFGGKVTAVGGSSGGAGIGGGSGSAGGTITIKGGKVSATGSFCGAGIGGGEGGSGGNITISGGTVSATGGSGGGWNGALGTISITGGTVTATGKGSSAGIGGWRKTDQDGLTVGFSSDSDSLKASRYSALTVMEGKVLTDGEGGFYAGALDARALRDIAGKTLIPAAYSPTLFAAAIDGNIKNGKVLADPSEATLGTIVNLTVTPDEGYGLVQVTCTPEGGVSKPVAMTLNDDGTFTGSFNMPDVSVTVSATFSSTLYTVSIDSGFTNGSFSASSTEALVNTIVTLTATPDEGYVLDGVTYTPESGDPVAVPMSPDDDGTLTGRFIMPDANVTLTATFLERPVPYIDLSGGPSDKQCKYNTTFDLDTMELTAGWWVVKESAKIDNRLTVSGDVRLILCDGVTLTATKGITVNAGNSLNIYGQRGGTGTLYAGTTDGTDVTCDRNCAGIGRAIRGTGRVAGAITIHGVNVTAIGSDSSAGIGGSNGASSEITILGGTVTATGGKSGAGIGGGNNGAGGTITIKDGTVTATGGLNGAGIGGGDTSENGGKIWIYDGTITASGGYNGAGIGGGSTVTVNRAHKGSGGEINILGGTVTATGGVNGAGIGGGGPVSLNDDDSGVVIGEDYGNTGGSIEIYGGTITATGGFNGAGIGGGYNGAGGDVIIRSYTGTTVTATGGYNGAGIGGGCYGAGGNVSVQGSYGLTVTAQAGGGTLPAMITPQTIGRGSGFASSGSLSLPHIKVLYDMHSERTAYASDRVDTCHESWVKLVDCDCDERSLRYPCLYCGSGNVGVPIIDPEPGSSGGTTSLSDAQKPAAASGLTANGAAQPLVTAPSSLPEGYSKVQYSLDGGNTWTDDIPTGTDPGTYTVMVKYVGDETHADFVGDAISVTIAKAADSDHSASTVATPEDIITIKKAPASVKAKAAKKGKVTVSWKKIKKTKKTKALLAQIKGIEVQYSTDPTFTNDVTTKNLGKKKTKVTLKLQKKTVYYIRVRYTDGAGGVSNWSKVRKVKTK